MPERAHVAVLDYGVKSSIVNLLRGAGARVTVLPWDATSEQMLALDADGILLGNGPGDPAALSGCVSEVRGLIGAVPVFGICLGHQLLGQALGLETFKLRFGHRGANHPVHELESGKVLVTAQNHGFAVRGPDAGRPSSATSGRGRSPISRSTTVPSRASSCTTSMPARCSFIPRRVPGPTMPATR